MAPLTNLDDDPFLRGLPRDPEGHPLLGGVPLLECRDDGGLVRVYRAVSPWVLAPVAVRVLRPEPGPRGAARRRDFLDEAVLLGSPGLADAGLIPCFQHDVTGSLAWATCEWVPGSTGASLLAEPRFGAGLPTAMALTLLRRAAEAVAALHRRGVVHLRVEPGKLLVPLERPGVPALDAARLAPSGVAACADAPPRDDPVLVGTPGFLAPEQVDPAAGRVGPATDVYGLGATLFALLTGTPPARGATARELLESTRRGLRHELPGLRSDLPRSLVELVEECLRQAPGVRPRDAAALLPHLAALAPAPAPRGYHVLPGTLQSLSPPSPVDRRRWRSCAGCDAPLPVHRHRRLLPDGSFEPLDAWTYVCPRCGRVESPGVAPALDRARQLRCFDCDAALDDAGRCSACGLPRGWRTVACPWCRARQAVLMPHWLRGCDTFSLECVTCERRFDSLCIC